MFIIDPETGLPVDDNNDPAAAAATGAEEGAAPPADDNDDPLAALDKGIEEASDKPVEPEPEPEAPAEPVPGTPEAAAAEAAKAEKDKADKAAEPDKDAEAEISALGLKEKAAQRFRDLTAEVKTLAPIKAQLEAAGIKDVADLPRVVKSAQDGEYLIESIEKTGVTPEDFTRLLAYGSTIAAARTGDRAAVERAFEEVGKEYAAIAAALGKEVPGVFDPLAEFPDLVEEVGTGDMPRARALELAQSRRTQAAVAQQNEATQAKTRQQQEAQQAQQRGLQSLVAWEQQTVAKDPQYAAKRAALNAKVAEIRKQFPPEQWAAATELAYQAIPAPAPAAPTPPPSGNPIRPTGPRGTLAPTQFASDADALDFGIQQASG